MQPTRQLSNHLPLAEFTYNNTPSATTSITLFFSNKGYHPKPHCHPKCDPASTYPHDFVTDLNELHQQLRQHIAKLNIETKPLLIPNNLQLQNLRLEVMHSSRPNSSI